MKKVIFIILGIILLTSIIVLIKNDLYSIETSNKSTEVTSTTSARVLNIPEPLTLASLEARDDWNPTMEVEGMVRVEDGVTELSNSGVGVYKYRVMANSYHESNLVYTGITFIYPDPHYDYSLNNKNCRYYTPTGSDTSERDCTATPIADMNEFIIVSEDTGEVLHKYKLDEKYSLADKRWGRYDPLTTTIGTNILREDTNMPIHIYKWNNWNDEEPAKGHHYVLNLLTGEIRNPR